MKQSVWWSCLLGVALGMLGLTGCSKPAEPVQPPKTEPVAAQTPAVIDIPEIKIPTESEAKNPGLFKEYVNQLRAGDLMQASANLATLKGHLKGEDLGDPFWNANLPLEHRVILMVGVLCTACTDGSCPTCKGRTICQTCEGTGLCKLCKGKGGEWLPCLKCICKVCNGARFCPECKGRRFLVCPTCNGTGTGREEQKYEPCPSCGGRGYKDGLKGPNGVASRIKCMRCNGAKGLYTTVRFPCAACDGTGRKNCDTCRGTGVCPGCRGVGRTPNCPVCAGQGRYLEACPACKGAKVCPDCLGSKLCQTCKGHGTCRECQGHNLVIRHRFPIDRRWLAKPEGLVLHPGQTGLLPEPLTGTSASLTINGRTVTADVPAGSILWASAPEDLQRIRELFKPVP